MTDAQMTHKEQWSGHCCGIRWRVCWWERLPREREQQGDATGRCWNYYLDIDERQVPFDHRAELESILHEIHWHGDILLRWYKEDGDLWGLVSRLEAGCDYAHLGDDLRTYTKEMIWSDCQRTIRELLAAAPWLLVRDPHTGELVEPAEVPT